MTNTWRKIPSTRGSPRFPHPGNPSVQAPWRGPTPAQPQVKSKGGGAETLAGLDIGHRLVLGAEEPEIMFPCSSHTHQGEGALEPSQQVRKGLKTGPLPKVQEKKPHGAMSSRKRLRSNTSQVTLLDKREKERSRKKFMPTIQASRETCRGSMGAVT